jgi:lipoyl synthase
MPDGGASHFAKTIELVKKKSPKMYVESLSGDFRGNLDAIKIMANSGVGN